jgi:hypothetical protein
MIKPRLTTQEAIALDHALSFLIEGPPPDPKAAQEILDGLKRDPDLQKVWDKVKSELDNLAQAQRMLLSQPEPQPNLTTDEIIAMSCPPEWTD